MKKISGWMWVLVFALLPIFLWAEIIPLSYRFYDTRVTLVSISQMCALSGTILFTFNYILSARVNFINDVFGGLDKVYKAHKRIGILATTLLLVHPTLLATSKFLESSSALMEFLKPGLSAQTAGSIALTVLISVVFITLYLPIRYERWRIAHKTLGVALFFASLHIYFIPSDIYFYTPLRAYMLAFVFLGVGSYLYRTFLFKYAVKRYDYTVDTVEKLNKLVTEITFKPVGKGIERMAGQFAFFSFNSKGTTNEVHPFTISSPPDLDGLRITVKNLGNFTSSISKVKKGDNVKVEGPYGKFTYSNYGKRQVWIAGGIGVTPFLSMASEAIDAGYKVDMYYSVSTKGEAVHLNELDFLSRNKGFNLHTKFTEKEGRFDVKDIINETNSSNAHYFICGPKGMIQSIKSELKDNDVKKSHIHSEEFALR